MHDQVLVIPEGQNHIHIRQAPSQEDMARMLAQPTRADELMFAKPPRIGTYSRVSNRGCWNDFEWDGWKDGH
jgi:hypothetical protein